LCVGHISPCIGFDVLQPGNENKKVNLFPLTHEDIMFAKSNGNNQSDFHHISSSSSNFLFPFAYFFVYFPHLNLGPSLLSNLLTKKFRNDAPFIIYSSDEDYLSTLIRTAAEFSKIRLEYAPVRSYLSECSDRSLSSGGRCLNNLRVFLERRKSEVLLFLLLFFRKLLQAVWVIVKDIHLLAPLWHELQVIFADLSTQATMSLVSMQKFLSLLNIIFV
jgi:hypothetical protein